MEQIDHCTYEHEGFRISYDGATGYWTATDPEGEFMTTIADLKEAMIYIEDAAAHAEPQTETDGDYSHYGTKKPRLCVEPRTPKSPAGIIHPIRMMTINPTRRRVRTTGGANRRFEAT